MPMIVKKYVPEIADLLYNWPMLDIFGGKALVGYLPDINFLDKVLTHAYTRFKSILALAVNILKY